MHQTANLARGSARLPTDSKMIFKELIMSKILIGSKYFFSCYEDFEPHDEDWLEIIDTNEFNQIRHGVQNLHNKKKNICFQLKFCS